MSNVTRPKGPNDTQVSVNIPGDWVDELDRLAEVLTRDGLQVTRSDALRLAIRKGLDVLAKAKR